MANEIRNIIESKKIENIIFDLGGVLLDIDFEQTKIAFNQLGIGDFNAIFSHMGNNSIFYDFEKGLISAENFRIEVKRELNLKISDSVFDSAWNALLLKYTNERIELLKILKKTYRTFLLSNTNIIHYYHYSETLKRNHNIEKLESLFEKAYFSFDCKMRKPDAEIYEFVLNNSNLIPEKTLFIDDFIENIEAAKKLGIQTYHLTGELITNF